MSFLVAKFAKKDAFLFLKAGNEVVMQMISYEEQIKGLSKISKAITSDLYLEDILRLIVVVTAEVMRSNICSILLIDEKRNERAKGVLMKEEGLTEEQAYLKLQRYSMNYRKTMREVAEAIILATDIKGRERGKG